MTQIRFANNGDLMKDILPKPFTTLFDSLLTDVAHQGGQLNVFRPQAEISETEEMYQLQLSVPGYKKENINISLDGNKLHITGEIKLEKEAKDAENTDDKKVKYYLREIYKGNFARTFTLPKNADTDNIDASLNDGLLNLAIPKSKEKTLGKSINIR